MNMVNSAGDTETRGTTENSLTSLGAVDFGEATNALSVAAGHDHTCALTFDRDVRCWGLNADGAPDLVIAECWPVRRTSEIHPLLTLVPTAPFVQQISDVRPHPNAHQIIARANRVNVSLHAVAMGFLTWRKPIQTAGDQMKIARDARMEKNALRMRTVSAEIVGMVGFASPRRAPMAFSTIQKQMLITRPSTSFANHAPTALHVPMMLDVCRTSAMVAHASPATMGS